MANVISSIEDYLCDLCDSVFSDGIVCDKVYNPEQQENRAAFVTQALPSPDDQNGIGTYTAQILQNRTKRSECIQDAELFRKNFIKYGDDLQNELAIYISVQYITMPIKRIVGTSTTYTISVMLNITVK